MGGHISKETVNCNQKVPQEEYNQDPRSPTPEISRTPIDTKHGAKHDITKNMDLRKTFETTNDEELTKHESTILSAVIKNHLQFYDPRSPTQEFDRTPIILASKLNVGYNMNVGDQQANELSTPTSINIKMKNEVLKPDSDAIVPKKLCDEFDSINLNCSLQDSNAQLESSTISDGSVENESSHKDEVTPKQFLETNFDYVEPQDQHEEMCTSQEKKLRCHKSAIPVFRILENDPRSPSTGIDRTPIVVPKLDVESIGDNVEEMTDEYLIKALQYNNSELRSVKKNTQPNTEGLLIYEDDSDAIRVTPKVSKSANNSGSRTPLSCMKNKGVDSHMRSKSANTLISPASKNSQTKLQKRISHIPRLKTLTQQYQHMQVNGSLKTISKSVLGDCENTPPNSHRGCWDKDSSVVL